ncbi:DUF1883 domain-containing protein [Mycobacterium sp. C31M]
MTAQGLHKDLGHLPRGAVVRVHIKGTGPNVRLFNNSNYREYIAGRWDRAKGHNYRPTRSPVDIPIPRGDHWHLVVDFVGLRGRAEVTHQVLNPTG